MKNVNNFVEAVFNSVKTISVPNRIIKTEEELDRFYQLKDDLLLNYSNPDKTFKTSDEDRLALHGGMICGLIMLLTAGFYNRSKLEFDEAYEQVCNLFGIDRSLVDEISSSSE